MSAEHEHYYAAVRELAVANDAWQAALREAAAIAHRYCWMPGVNARMENDASRIEDAILDLASSGGPSLGGRYLRAAYTLDPGSGQRPGGPAPCDTEE